MSNGQQLAEENVLRFAAWVGSKTDDDFRGMASRGVLSRTEIAMECGFAKSALSQNPRIRDRLKALEDALRERGILPKAALKTADAQLETRTQPAEGVMRSRDAARLKRLEHENASLRAELAEVKRALSRYSLLQDALAETGRLPR